MFQFRRPVSRDGSRGFAFVYALMGIAIISTIFYIISSFVNLHSRKTYEDLNVSQGRMILHSLMDYTVLAVKSRYCLTESWLPEKAGCDLNHPRSIDRLVISPDSERYITKLVKAKKLAAPTPIRLEEVRSIVNLSDLLPDHPLYEMIAPLKLIDNVSKISFLVRRDKRPKMATTGRETFLHVEVELLEGNGNVATFVGSPLKASVDLSVFPRELGSMALIVANDLHMDMGFTPVENGNFNVHMFQSRAAASGYAGLVFASPVLVNGDVYLPPQGGGYAPVTFADKVFFPGRLYRGGEIIFSPKAAGRSDDQLWTDIREFGGFQRGVEIEPGYDKGLSVLSGGGSTAVDTSLAEQCLELIQVKSELKWTNRSALQGRLIDGTLNDGLRYRFGFNSPANFPNPLIPQPSTWKAPGASFSGSKPDGAGIGSYTSPQYPLGGLNPLPGVVVTATLTIKTPSPGPGPGSTTRIALNMEYGSKWSYKWVPPTKEEKDKLKDRKKDLDKEEKEVDDRLKEPDLTPVEKSFLMAKKDKIKKEIEDIDKQLDALEDIAKKSSNIELEARPVMSDKDGPHPVYVDLVYKQTGEIASPPGKQSTVDMKVEAFDISCRAGVEKCREEIFPLPIFPNPNDPYRLGYERNAYVRNIHTGTATVVNDSGVVSTALIEGPNFAALENKCTYKGQSFGGVSWDLEMDSKFSQGAPLYWNFAGHIKPSTNCPTVGEYCLDNTNARYSPTGTVAPQFHVRSIVPVCRIRNSANFVAGFFSCERMIIEARSEPLTIVGTVVITKGLQIDPSAYRAGIWWSSIYNSMATPELRRAKILKPNTGGGTCDNLGVPMWHPYPSMSDTANVEACNVGILRSQAKPFTWTQVDPDCGLIDVPGEIPYACKNQLTRYQVFEIFRESRL